MSRQATSPAPMPVSWVVWGGLVVVWGHIFVVVVWGHVVVVWGHIFAFNISPFTHYAFFANAACIVCCLAHGWFRLDYLLRRTL